MEHLLALLDQLLADPQRVRTAFVATVALTIFALGLALMVVVLGATDPVRRRLRGLSEAERRAAPQGERLKQLLESASPYVLPKEGWERSRISRTLVQAGYRAPNAVTLFFGVKLLLGLLLPAVVLVAATQLPRFSTVEVLFAAGVAGFLGMMLPNAWLGRAHERRMRRVRNGFPDALDLLVVCVEAGLGIAAALQRVANELAISHRELAEELALVSAEMQAGVNRADALRNLGERTGLEDVQGFVSLIAQSLRFGTSVAEALRMYAEEFRDKRMQAAEEQAGKIGTKLIFPLVLCLFPSFFLVAVGPAILGVLRALSEQGF
jgi:tight adherence protein C